MLVPIAVLVPLVLGNAISVIAAILPRLKNWYCAKEVKEDRINRIFTGGDHVIISFNNGDNIIVPSEQLPIFEAATEDSKIRYWTYVNRRRAELRFGGVGIA
ncbi:MAG: hypothetical protein PVI21_05205 [Candidatus Woesebacteria bacterium]|jgi:hypothetical protein